MSRLDVRPFALNILLWFVVVIVAVDIVGKLGFLAISGAISPILVPLFAGLFLIADVGIVRKKVRARDLDAVDWILLTIGILSLVGIAIMFFTTGPIFLTPVIIWAEAILGVAIVVSIFKK